MAPSCRDDSNDYQRRGPERPKKPPPSESSVMPEKRHLGDGVYVEFDGHGLVLTTEDGISTRINRIYLEPNVIEAFSQYNRDVAKEI